MRVKIKRIDKNLPLPEYQTKGSVAFDVYSRTEMLVPPKEVARIPTNLIIEIPVGYMLTVVTRSSTPKRKGLLVPHGIGIIDQDHCGEQDEILCQVYNFTDKEVKVEKGERIGQAVFVPIDIAEWEEKDTMIQNSRGNFGSTG